MPFSAQHIKAARLHLMQSSPKMKQVIKQVGPFTARMNRDERAEQLKDLADDQVVERLLDSGANQQDAESYLFFALGRMDILPMANPEFVKKVMLLFELPGGVETPEWNQLTDSWRPFRSVAGWYMTHYEFDEI